MAGGPIAVGAAGGRAALYHGRATLAVIITCIIGASGGLLFGYDIGVTGGVESFDSFKAKFFPGLLEPHPDSSAYCKYNDQALTLFTSSMFLAGCVSSLFGSWTTKHWGRRTTMIMGGCFFLVGAILQSAAVQIGMLVVGRLVLGAGVGLANQSVPLYLSEMAPYHLRGALNIMFQMATTIGIFVAQLINYRTGQWTSDVNWRISLGLAGIPALILIIGMIFMTDSPDGLVQRNKLDEAKRVLKSIRGTEEVDAEFEDICEAAAAAATVKNPWRTIVQKRYRPQLVVAVLVPFFQQFTGINSIMFYAPQLFDSLQSNGTQAALLNTVIIGAINVASTLVAIFVVDRAGRKALFLEGGIQMIVALIPVGAVLGVGFSKYGTNLPNDYAGGVLFLICLFVSAFAWSWGPLGWLLPSEIQPLETRSAGQSITVCTNFLMSFLIGQAFQAMLCGMRFGVFWFFAAFTTMATIFVMICVPETKDVPIERIEQLFADHWFWRKTITEASAKPATHISTASVESSPRSSSSGEKGQPNKIQMVNIHASSR